MTNKVKMKGFIGLLLLLPVKITLAQYYYKDIILNSQAIEKWKSYKEAKTRAVVLHSFEGNGQPTEGFECRQTIAGDFSTIITYTKADNLGHASTLTAIYNTSSGLLKQTIDTSDTYQSTTDYDYDANGKISTITNTSVETDNQVRSVEKHIWNYNQNGVPSGMLKVRDNTDTTYVQFATDGKGNITEEHPMRNGIALPTVYYYYNADNLLTDIVRYNQKAQRLLPDYMFEYDNNKRLSSMLFVHEGSTDYQRWIYDYNEKGLKTRESCFNKKKELLGRIEYEYNYK
jgi:hypothetical protein